MSTEEEADSSSLKNPVTVAGRAFGGLVLAKNWSQELYSLNLISVKTQRITLNSPIKLIQKWCLETVWTDGKDKNYVWKDQYEMIGKALH